jgi:predicted TIM-barrel fold metal-dependent hydrolase
MQFIDAHHHLWDLEKFRYPWLVEPVDHFAGDYGIIRRSYRIADFLADAAGLEAEGLKLVKSVHLQAELDHGEDPATETAWLQSVADDPASRGLPQAIVAYADLAAPDIEAVLARHGRHPNLRGIRQILNHGSEPQHRAVERGDLMGDEAWRRGFALLEKYGLSFDLQIWPWQMEAAAALARDFPATAIILNHTGMPLHRDAAGLEIWRRGMARLAAQENVAVKISGLGMFERDWTTESIRPFVEETIEIFGAGRAMFASNFPVDKLAGSYRRIWRSFVAITAGLPDRDRRGLFHDNAERVYRI